jgi:hypothetical protein
VADLLFPLGLFLLVPGFIALALYLQHQRVKAIQAWAAGTGWTYVGMDPALVGRWRGEPFNAGHSRRVSELVAGRFAGRQAMSFSYRYTTGSGKSRSTHVFHVVAVPLPAYLPTLELTPEGVGAKLAKAFGGQDIEFESEDFNRDWRVEARDAKFAHDVLHPRLMERLLRPDAGGSSLRIEGTDILSWTPGAQQLDAIAGRLQLMCAVVDAIPRYVWQDHGHDPGPAAEEPRRGPGPGPGSARPV